MVQQQGTGRYSSLRTAIVIVLRRADGGFHRHAQPYAVRSSIDCTTVIGLVPVIIIGSVGAICTIVVVVAVIGCAIVAGNQRTHHNQAEKNCKKLFHFTSSIISFWLHRVINSMHQKYKNIIENTKIERRHSSAPFYLSNKIISR